MDPLSIGCVIFGVCSILWMSFRQDRIKGLKELTTALQARVLLLMTDKEELLKVNANRLGEIESRDMEIAGLNKLHEMRDKQLADAKAEAKAVSEQYFVTKGMAEQHEMAYLAAAQQAAAQQIQIGDLKRELRDLKRKPKANVHRAKPTFVLGDGTNNLPKKPKKVSTRTPKKAKQPN